MNKFVAGLAVVTALLWTASPSDAASLSLYDFAVFSGGGTTFLNSDPETDLGEGSVINGLVGSNQDVRIVNSGIVNAAGVYVGGKLIMGQNSAIKNGASLAEVVANNGAEINGDIDGNLFVTGNVELFSSRDINKVGGLGGNIEYTGTIAGVGCPGACAGVDGTATDVASTTTFSLISMPSASVMTAGATAPSCSISCTITPDAYGALTTGAGATVNLTSGTYTFSSLQVGKDSTINIDLSSGNPINIYVVGVATLVENTVIKVKGPSDAGFNLFSAANQNLAALVYLESKNVITIGKAVNGGGTVYSSVLEMNSDEETVLGESGKWTGALYAFDSMVIGKSATVNYVGSYLGASAQQTGAPVPEPASLLLLGTGLVAAARSARRRIRRESPVA